MSEDRQKLNSSLLKPTSKLQLFVVREWQFLIGLIMQAVFNAEDLYGFIPIIIQSIYYGKRSVWIHLTLLDAAIHKGRKFLEGFLWHWYWNGFWVAQQHANPTFKFVWGEMLFSLTPNLMDRDQENLVLEAFYSSRYFSWCN